MTNTADDAMRLDLDALAGELLEQAATGHSRRASRTLPHPVDGLRQTMIALCEGAGLQEHNSPGPAAILVLRGTARLIAGDDVVDLERSCWAAIPPRRHSLDAVTDTVVLLSVGVEVPSS